MDEQKIVNLVEGIVSNQLAVLSQRIDHLAVSMGYQQYAPQKDDVGIAELNRRDVLAKAIQQNDPLFDPTDVSTEVMEMLVSKEKDLGGKKV